MPEPTDRPPPIRIPEPHSGPLTIRGGGTVGVETDAMAAAAVRLDALEAVLRELAQRAGAAPRIVGAGHLLIETPLDPGADARADALAGTSADLSRTAADRAEELRSALRRAATGYEEAERAARRAIEQASEVGATALGYNAGPVLGAVFGAALGAWLAWSLAPGTSDEKKARLREWMVRHPRLVTTPEFVLVVRCIAGATDDAVRAAGRIPAPLGSEGSGVEVGGDAVLAAGALVGLFRESSVRVSRVGGPVPTTPPSGIAERLRRIPEGNQVRIEKYAAPGRAPRWIVYVDPTETFTPTATSEPWDLTSNVDGVAGHSAGAFRATEAAMRDAGVAPGDPVAFVGFSEGGLIAGMLAGSGHWNTQGLESFAGPIGNIPLPDDLPGMTVRHTDDFVPALAGPDLPSDRLLVEQRAFTGEIPTAQAAPAHQRTSYVATATDIDAAESPAIRAQLRAMHDFAADEAARPGAESESYLYHAVRDGDWRPAFTESRVPRPSPDRVG